MDKHKLSQLADLAGDDGGPQASILTPEVRSGASFTYDDGKGDETAPPFLVVWFYTVSPKQRGLFTAKVRSYEGSSEVPDPKTGVSYRGTYSVSISGAAPDLEYRTFWGLTELAKLQELNNYLSKPSTQLTDVLDLILAVPAMRSEIMGLTRNSAPLVSTEPVQATRHAPP